MEIAEAYIERVGAWNLRPLLGVINAPTLRSDGSILQLPGYDEVTGLLFDPAGQDFAIIDENPSQEDALLAVTTLKTAIETYPFVSDADRSVALSGILTALIRGSIATVPLHGFSAPTPGTGKSALVDIASIISAGHEAAVISPGGTEEELQKRLQSSILAGDLLISIDNCDDEIGGAFFCQMLTQTMLKIRVLGKSVNIELRSNSTIFATGNNLRVDGDMSRRTLISSLDAGCENPELRVFEFDPLERAKSNRSALVSAGLTILRAYHVAGRPAPAFPSLGSFNQWSDWIRSALIWCGEADPCDTMEKVRQTDPKRDALGAALALWNAAVGQRRVSVKECISAASSCAHADFRDALLMVAGDGSDINPLRLGKWLSKHAGRPINGLKFVPDGILAGSQQWRVSQV